jgi:hypothetical protein
MRICLVLAAAVILGVPAIAAEADTARRVKVALALVSHQPAIPVVEDDDPTRTAKVALALAAASQLEQGCGRCRTDLAGCQADAKRLGVPLILFVGEGACDGTASKQLPSTWVMCRLPSYQHDPGRLADDAPRIVICTPAAMTPGAVGVEMFIRKAVATTTDAKAIEAIANPAKPMPTVRDTCPNGVCPLR